VTGFMCHVRPSGVINGKEGVLGQEEPTQEVEDANDQAKGCCQSTRKKGWPSVSKHGRQRRCSAKSKKEKEVNGSI